MNEHVSVNNFDRRFEEREKITSGVDQFFLVDLVPETPKSPVPVLFLAGWAATPLVHKEDIVLLAEAGRRVIAVDAVHGIEPSSELLAGKWEWNIPYVELRKIAALFETIRQKQLSKVDIVAHSEAAMYASYAAAMRPEHIRSIVLVNPVGLIGKDTLPGLVRRFTRDFATAVWHSFRRKELRAPLGTAVAEMNRALLDRPLLTVKEVVAISRAEIPAVLRVVHEKGVRTGLIHSTDDIAFPMEHIQRIAEENRFGCFYAVKGTHNLPYLDPKTCVRLVDQALGVLAGKE